MTCRRLSAHGLARLAPFFIAIALAMLLVSTAVGAESAVAPVTTTESVASAGEVADPAADPWLSDQAPVLANPVEVAEERVDAAWRGAHPTDHARAAALRRVRLEFGLGDLVGPATVIAANATDDERHLLTDLARDLAPGVPAFRFDHAFALLGSGDTGAGTLALVEAGWAIAQSLVAQLWWLENVSYVVLAVLVAASFAFMLLAALLVWPHAAHDLGDLLSADTPNFARHAALAALLLTPVVFGEGLLGFALALFALGFWYGGSRQRNALAMAAILFVVGVHPVAKLSAVSRQLVDGDPVVASTLRVLGDHEATADVEVLEAAAPTDAIAAHALAYRDRRHGLTESSRERLLAIVEAHPSDFVALANLGNIEQRRGNGAAAIDYYERAAAVEYDATLLFDLSQAYAGAFRMEEYEATIARAQGVDGEEVAALSSLGEATLVADLGFPMFQLRDRFTGVLLAAEAESRLMAIVVPGRLSGAWYVTAGAFAILALLGLLVADRWDHASNCHRCGHRICNRCEDTVWSSEICEDCHHLFQYPEATDPSLRMARLQALSEREVRFDRVWLALSILVPGVAGFSARRPDLAMLGLLFFAWIAAAVVWPTGPFEDPLLMGDAAWLAFALPGVIAAFAYAGVVVLGLIVRKSR